MRKHIFLLGLAVVLAGANFLAVQAKQVTNLNSIISMYKAGNYSGCIQALEPFLEKDPSNAIAHYYMALASAQAGRVEEAISHYDTVIQLNTQVSLVKYATKGKLCLQNPDQCNAAESLDDFIRSQKGFDITNSVKNEIETQKLESIRRDINNNKEIAPERFKQYKQFSNAEPVPTNDEIVAALRTLQRAGLAAPQVPSYGDLSAIYSGSVPGNSSVNNLLDMISGYSSSAKNEKIDPRVLQSIMTTQMMGL